MSAFGEWLKSWLLPVISGLSAALLGYLTWYTDGQFRDLEQRLKEQEVLLRQKQSTQNFSLDVYKEVTASLKGSDARQQRVAAALVTAMVEDETLRTGLLTVLKEGGVPEIKTELTRLVEAERVFNQAQQAVVAPQVARARTSSDWGEWDIDLFWCERSGEAARGQAENLHQALLNEGAKGRIRVRNLPDSVNARPGYQHTGYVIRQNAGEEQQAARLKQLAERGLGGGVRFEITLSRQATPWYLSAFLCPQ